MGASDAVDALLAALGHTQPLDAEVLEYVSAVVADPDPESTLEVLTGVLAECVPAFAALGDEQQAELVLKLLEDVTCGGQPEASCVVPASNEDTALHAVVAAIRQVSLQQEHVHDAVSTQRAAASSSARCSSSGDSSSGSSHGGGGCQEPHLGPLLELCPPAMSHQFLAHCLRHRCQGNVEAAADWMLETGHDELLRLQDVFHDEQLQEEEQRMQAEHEKKLAKKQIVERFDLRVVSDSSGGAKKGRPGPELLPGKKAAPPESKVRYRDGKVVSTKGEKVIIEKVGEDWDGGSRGKVYTKGKRGKGFH